ncbi:MAG: oxidoreductase [bacterium (Candidatus Stahlbacteria) CG23_combo_of_CG06-09_8_20_14_all_34_7]|nr:MAG: oxidoreductase [bacterium (Candidatus Stahlbacteria) CG23_combo_of_CG06-09_8_20_14_all_34_7]
MLSISQNMKSGKIELAEVPAPSCKKDGVLIKTSYSLVSMGTESMKIESGKMNLIEKARAKPEQVRQVINTVKQLGIKAAYRKVMNKLDSMTPLGYAISGLVVETGSNVSNLKISDMVAAGGGNYATHAEFNYVPENLCVKLSDKVDIKHASMATVAAIAIQGLRQANLQFGETIGIVGMGLIGQLMLQIAQTSGFRVLAIDIDENRVNISLKHGANAGAIPIKENLVEAAMALTEGFGLDALFLTSGTKSNQPVELAPKMLRDRGRLVDIGITKMDIPWQPYYDKELNIFMSRSYGPGRYDPLYEEHSIDYPISYVRFTEQRNMKTFINLLEDKKIDVDYIISETMDFSKAADFYNSICESKSKYISVVFSYNPSAEIKRTFDFQKPFQSSVVRIGIIGSGNFAKTMLFPELKNKSGVEFVSLSTATGLSAEDSRRKFNFSKIGTNSEEVITDKDINLLMVLTRHSSHSSNIIKGLRADKFVYCEKPLALDETELKNIIEAKKVSKGDLFIGYNRRFSPAINKIKNMFSKINQPKHLYYRVNAGYMEKTNWYNDIEEGNRIVGEAGHFVDTALYLIDSRPRFVTGIYTGISRKDMKTKDNMNIIIEFENGSVADILYFTFGDKSLPKEYLEISSSMQSAVLDNFKSLTLFKNGSPSKVVLINKGKGHKEEMHSLVEIIKGNEKNPFNMDYLSLVSMITFKAIESADRGVKIEL